MANRTATSVLFGFDFQANAAIVLMLENIKDMTSIRLEGAEDIEINLNDGSCFEVNPKSFLSNFWGLLQYGLCNFFSTDTALIYSV